MPSTTLHNPAGSSAGSVELADDVFGVQPNVPVMHQVVTAQLARRRSGTQSTKTRSEVRGGGAKPYRQKGTGNARQGSIRAPHFSGGGIALGPKPRSYAQKTPKKMIRLALASALSDRNAEGKVVVVDAWSFETPRTKDAVAALDALGLDGRVLLVVAPDDAATALSFRNIPGVQLITPGELNCYDVLCNDWIVFSQNTLPGAATDAEAQPAKPAKKATATKVQGFASVTPPAEGSASDETDASSDDDASDTASASDEADASPNGDASDTASDTALPAGAAAALADGSQPDGFSIKGNANSMLYHVPGSAFYERTEAEIWFDTPESAEAAGYQLPPSQRDDEEGSK